MTPEGEALGLSLGALAQQVRQAFYGEEAQRIQRGRDDVRVMVRYTEAERESLASLDDMRVRTSEGLKFLFGPSRMLLWGKAIQASSERTVSEWLT